MLELWGVLEGTLKIFLFENQGIEEGFDLRRCGMKSW